MAVIDQRPLGGTCALRGCDPKKVLVGASAALDHARRLLGHGLSGEIRIDWAALMQRKRSFTDPVPESQARGYASAGIPTFAGEAAFETRDTLRVGAITLRFTQVVIAAGAEPAKLGIPGEDDLVTSDGFLELEALPQRIVFVGGGYIAAEFSHLAARAGAQVTILQRGPRMLEAFDPELTTILMDRFGELGIDVRTGATVTAIERVDRGYVVRAATSSGPVAIETDMVIHAAGRVPALTALNLAAGGVDASNGRLVLNEYLQSVSNPAVYAAGDSAQSGPPLTPIAGRDGHVVAANLLSGNHRTPDYRAVPSVAFTVPPIAAVGLSEKAARERTTNLAVQYERASDWYTARQAAESVYGYKVLIDRDTDAILGAHLVGPHAEEIINIFALVLRQNISVAALRDSIFAYPTAASDIGYMLG